jgi:hypothetical protein
VKLSWSVEGGIPVPRGGKPDTPPTQCCEAFQRLAYRPVPSVAATGGQAPFANHTRM